MISFTGGCVINLDDLEDFPDYFEVMTKLLNSLRQKQSEVDWKSMGIFLDSDIEDVQHMPEFMQLITQLIKKYEQIFTKNNEKKQRFIIMLLKVIKNYFTSYTLQENEVAPILSILQKQMTNYCSIFCDFWLSISKFAPYVEKHQELVQLYLKVIDERTIFSNEEMSLFYVKSVDKILRFRMFREAFKKISKQKYANNLQHTPFLNFKIQLHQQKQNTKIKQQKLEILQKFVLTNQKSSSYILNYIKNKNIQLA